MSHPASRSRVSPTLTLAAASLGFAIVILDVTVVNVALERIEASFATDVTGLQWVLNAYTLVFASFLLSAGALCDRLGAKQVFIGGLALFTASSFACAMADTINVLIVSRLVQGLGAALCVPASLALVSASFPDAAARARAVSIWAGVGGLAIAAGPVVGGLAVDALGWPSIFLLNLPLGLAGIWLTLAYAPSSEGQSARGLDLPGQTLAVMALGGLTLGFIESGALGWTHPLVLTGFACCALTTVAFLLTEARSATPMLPLSVFRSSPISAACLSGLLMNFAFYGLMFVFSLFFQSAKNYSPLTTGLAFLPMTALITITNLAAGWLTAKFGPRLPLVLGQALAAIGYFSLAGIDATTPYAVIVAPLLATGIGSALAVPAMTTAVLAHADKQQVGIASGALNAARQTGGVIGVGVFGSLVARQGDLSGSVHAVALLAGLALVIGCLIAAIGLRTRIGKTIEECRV